jgi:hypothetical protein
MFWKEHSEWITAKSVLSIAGTDKNAKGIKGGCSSLHVTKPGGCQESLMVAICFVPAAASVCSTFEIATRRDSRMASRLRGRKHVGILADAARNKGPTPKCCRTFLLLGERPGPSSFRELAMGCNGWGVPTPRCPHHGEMNGVAPVGHGPNSPSCTLLFDSRNVIA